MYNMLISCLFRDNFFLKIIIKIKTNWTKGTSRPSDYLMTNQGFILFFIFKLLRFWDDQLVLDSLFYYKINCI